MNIYELPKLFPAVLDGSCPLEVFADALEECGFELLAVWCRRRNQRKKSRELSVAQVRHVLDIPGAYQKAVDFDRRQQVCDVVLPLVYTAARRNRKR